MGIIPPACSSCVFRGRAHAQPSLVKDVGRNAKTKLTSCPSLLGVCPNVVVGVSGGPGMEAGDHSHCEFPTFQRGVAQPGSQWCCIEVRHFYCCHTIYNKTSVLRSCPYLMVSGLCNLLGLQYTRLLSFSLSLLKLCGKNAVVTT